MFSPSPDPLLHSLDQIVGSRETTREVIALATAAVLTASPHGQENDWLEEVTEEAARPELGRQIILSNRRPNSASPAVAGTPNGSREAALQHLLDTLDGELGSNPQLLLKRLARLAARALESESPASLKRWGSLLREAHRSVQSGYLTNNPDLN